MNNRPSNKKILIIANYCGALVDFRIELIDELIKDNKVTIVTPFDDKIDVLREHDAALIEVPVDRRGMNPIKDIRLYGKYKRIIKELRPDLVITYTIKPNIYAGYACRRLKVPYAVNVPGVGTAFQKTGLMRRLIVTMCRIGLKSAKTVFFENVENRQIFLDARIVTPEQACLLHGAGINLERFTLKEYPAGDTTRFLFVGRVMKEKGVDELFAAMRALRADGVDCVLDVLGPFEEDYRSRMDEYAGEGWLNYHGYQPDVRPFIADSHCFVLPSWHEGMANTNLESAASGRPVITSRIHGCMEAVEDGVTGFLCERKDPDDLLDKMRRFVSLSYDERRAMGLAGRRHMEEVFDKKKVVEETLDRL